MVETVAKVRRLLLVQGLAIKAICRELGLSRKVVRKVLRSGATEFRYERTHQPMPKLCAWQGNLDRLLEENAVRVSGERLTLMRVFEALRGPGNEGGYDTVRRYARGRSRSRAATPAAVFVPLSFAPGEAYQFDWSHEVVLIGGTTVTVKVAQVRLCHRRMLFVRAYPRETPGRRIRRRCSTRTTVGLRSFAAPVGAQAACVERTKQATSAPALPCQGGRAPHVEGGGALGPRSATSVRRPIRRGGV